MDEKFYQEFFAGLFEGINKLSKYDQGELFQCCAKRCANTRAIERYKQHLEKVKGNKDLFYSTLGELGNMKGEVIQSGKKYAI